MHKIFYPGNDFQPCVTNYKIQICRPPSDFSSVAFVAFFPAPENGPGTKIAHGNVPLFLVQQILDDKLNGISLSRIRFFIADGQFPNVQFESLIITPDREQYRTRREKQQSANRGKFGRFFATIFDGDPPAWTTRAEVAGYFPVSYNGGAPISAEYQKELISMFFTNEQG